MPTRPEPRAERDSPRPAPQCRRRRRRSVEATEQFRVRMLRRVVITGLGLVTPLGCGVEASWSRLLAGQSGARRIEEFEVSDLACQIACFVPRGVPGRRHVQSRRLDGAQGAAQGRRLHHLRHGGGDAGARGRGLEGRHAGEAGAHRRPDRLRHRRPQRHRRDRAPAEGEGTASRQPVLHSGPPDQPRRRLRLDPARPQGPQPRRRHGLLDGCARHRRCRAADRARRRRRHGGGRHRKPDLPHRRCRLCRLPRALDRLQRPADQGLAPLRQGPRRLRDRRGRRHRRARGARARQGARRAHLCRGDRLRPVRRCLSTSRRRPRTATAPTAACAWR